MVEQGGRVNPIEVKARGMPDLADTKGLDVFLNEYGRKAPYGVLFHTGARTERRTKPVWAVSLAGLLGAA